MAIQSNYKYGRCGIKWKKRLAQRQIWFRRWNFAWQIVSDLQLWVGCKSGHFAALTRITIELCDGDFRKKWSTNGGRGIFPPNVNTNWFSHSIGSENGSQMTENNFWFLTHTKQIINCCIFFFSQYYISKYLCGWLKYFGERT